MNLFKLFNSSRFLCELKLLIGGIFPVCENIPPINSFNSQRNRDELNNFNKFNYDDNVDSSDDNNNNKNKLYNKNDNTNKYSNKNNNDEDNNVEVYNKTCKALLDYWGQGCIKIQIIDGERFNEDIFMGEVRNKTESPVDN